MTNYIELDSGEMLYWTLYLYDVLPMKITLFFFFNVLVPAIFLFMDRVCELLVLLNKVFIVIYLTHNIGIQAFSACVFFILLWLSWKLTNKILKPFEEATLKIMKKWEPLKWKHVKTEGTDDDDDKPCVICWGNINEGDDVISKICKHELHWNCGKKWFEARSVCPVCLCRVNLTTPTQLHS